MKLFTNIFRGLGNNKRKYLELEIVNLSTKNSDLKAHLENAYEYAKKLETNLKSVSNELTKANTEISDLKTSNISLKKESLKKDQLLEIKEEQRRESAGKLGGLTKENNKLKEENKEFKAKIKELEKELDKRYIIKTLKPTKPTKQTMSIKRSGVQSRIIKNIKGDYDEVE